MSPFGINSAKFWQGYSTSNSTTANATTSSLPTPKPVPPPAPKPMPPAPPRKRIEVRETTEHVLDHKRCKKIVELASKILREEKIEALAATGHSGLILAAILSNHLEIPLIAVRKNGEPSHDNRTFSALLDYGRTYRLCVLDDHIGGGGTLKHVITTIQAKLKDQVNPSLIFLYNSGKDSDRQNYQLLADKACKEINLPSIPVKGIGRQDYAE